MYISVTLLNHPRVSPPIALQLPDPMTGISPVSLSESQILLPSHPWKQDVRRLSSSLVGRADVGIWLKPPIPEVELDNVRCKPSL